MKKIHKHISVILGAVILIVSSTAFLSAQDSTVVVKDSAAVVQNSIEAVTETTATIVPTIDAGDTAWMIVATAFVLMMTIPGLAFFYGGLVRQKNVLNIMMQSTILTALITVQWIVFGYSISFGSSEGVLAP